MREKKCNVESDAGKFCRQVVASGLVDYRIEISAREEVFFFFDDKTKLVTKVHGDVKEGLGEQTEGILAELESKLSNGVKRCKPIAL